jgi:hypothetical protein
MEGKFVYDWLGNSTWLGTILVCVESANGFTRQAISVCAERLVGWSI